MMFVQQISSEKIVQKCWKIFETSLYGNEHEGPEGKAMKYTNSLMIVIYCTFIHKCRF